MARWIVRLRRGGPYDFGRRLREQNGFAEHAAFMDTLVEEGFLLLGGPLGTPPDGDTDTLHVVEAESEEAIRERWAADPWARDGTLSVVSVERWTVLLDGLGASG